MEFVNSEKSKPLIIYEGYKFSFHKKLKNNVQRWTCNLNSCKCFLKLSPSKEILQSNIDHNHSKTDKKILNRQILSNSLKTKAIRSLSCKPSKLINSELKQSDVKTLSTKDLSLIRHNIYRARSYANSSLANEVNELQADLDHNLSPQESITGDSDTMESSNTSDFHKPSTSTNDLFDDPSLSVGSYVDCIINPKQESQITIDDANDTSADIRYNDLSSTGLWNKSTSQLYNKRKQLEDSVKDTTDVGILSNKRNNKLENYNEKKLQLLQQQLELMERSVIAKEKIAESIFALANIDYTKYNEL